MAEGVVLKMKFDTMSGSRTWSFKNAKSNASVSDIKALGNAMIQNAPFFTAQPVKLADARVVTTTENVYDLDS